MAPANVDLPLFDGPMIHMREPRSATEIGDMWKLVKTARPFGVRDRAIILRAALRGADAASASPCRNALARLDATGASKPG
ncbi:hypothetical protein BGC_41420 [Burkholderia sp. 3C]